jgi:hypothetical protein
MKRQLKSAGPSQDMNIMLIRMKSSVMKRYDTGNNVVVYLLVLVIL